MAKKTKDSTAKKAKPDPKPAKGKGEEAAPAPRPGKPSALLDTRVIYCGDNLEQLAKLPDQCVDLLSIDPPFNSNRTPLRCGMEYCYA